MEIRYRALRIIAFIYNYLGIVNLAITIILAIIIIGLSIFSRDAFETLIKENPFYSYQSDGGNILFVGITISLLTLIYGGLISLTIYATGEGISLLISLEENTRKSAMLAEEAITKEKVICSKCGFEQSSNNNYCRRCGHSLNVESQS